MLRPILAVVALVAIVTIPLWAPAIVAAIGAGTLPSALAWLGPIASTLSNVSWTAAAVAGLGVAAAIDSDTVSKIVTDVGEVVGSVGAAIGEAAGATVGGFLTSPGGILLLGGLAIFFLMSNRSGEDRA